MLQESIAAAYAAMDFASRDRYRHVIEAVSKAGGLAEEKVASRAIELAQDLENSRDLLERLSDCAKLSRRPQAVLEAAQDARDPHPGPQRWSQQQHRSWLPQQVQPAAASAAFLLRLCPPWR